MKIAISGKGGVGKTTLAATMANILAQEGQRVIAIDADPVTNLAASLGIPSQVASSIVPISQMKDLIKERTGATSEEYGKFFKLNPKVSDLPDTLYHACEGNNNLRLMVLGGIKRGGGGCACPENVFLRTLLTHLILQRDEVVVVDMEAGIEHLGRATVQAVNAMIVVVEPGMRSIQAARQVQKLANEIGIKSIFAVGNKVGNKSHKEFLEKELSVTTLLGFISYNEKIMAADLAGKAVFEGNGLLISEVKEIIKNLHTKLHAAKPV